jgi:hypothetical protein
MGGTRVHGAERVADPNVARLPTLRSEGDLDIDVPALERDAVGVLDAHIAVDAIRNFD